MLWETERKHGETDEEFIQKWRC